MTIALAHPVPDFTLPIHPEGSLSRQDLLGKWTVLYFYPKDNTPGCTQESVEFQQRLSDFAALGAQVVGASRDSLVSHARFAAKFELTFPLISDEQDTLCHLFDTLKEKSLYGKKYMGIERSTFLIDPQGVLQAEWRKVSVKGHVETVLAKLNTLIN